MSDTDNKRERFGRYLILDHLVDGGMAKICRARFLGEQADKVVAIKMVQPQFSKDEAFKSMFMDEIKVTFGLIHPNIVQTYDYGLNKGQLFVAMEYCDGRNLKQYLDKLRERKFVFPVEITTFIISQACQGLHYAHTFRDKLSGLEANIIHRDISPHNIMLTYDGAVKIIDFGIAKSQSNTEATQAGTIKGKLSYLAPEYLEGLELDTRYDQFAIGITLWEMLCSRKLFKENNDLAVLKKIQECKVPSPSSINPNVPKELDEIVLKALSKDRTKRYDNLDQMNRALMKFLYSRFPDFNATDLSYFAQELFKDEIKADRLKMFEYGKIDIMPYIAELNGELNGGGQIAKPTIVREEDDDGLFKKEAMLDFGFEEKATPTAKGTLTARRPINARKKVTESSYTSEMVKDKSSNKVLSDLKSNDVSKVSVRKNTLKTVQTRSDITRSTRTEKIKASEVEKTSGGSSFIKIAMVLAVLGAAGYFLHDFMYGNSKYQEVAKTVEETKNRLPAQSGLGNEAVTGTATVSLAKYNKQKMRVFIDNEPVNIDLLGSFKAPIGKPFTLRVENSGRKHFIQEFNLMNDSQIEVEVPNMPLVSYGYLTSSKACTFKGEVRYNIFEEMRVSQVPIDSRIGIPFPINVDADDRVIETSHQIYFRRVGQKIEKAITIKFVREDQSIDICEYI